jgi:hypothetical protein
MCPLSVLRRVPPQPAHVLSNRSARLTAWIPLTSRAAHHSQDSTGFFRTLLGPPLFVIAGPMGGVLTNPRSAVETQLDARPDREAEGQSNP